ncbi:MAG: ankyrin repeat domain-containing protein [Planctomycetota bacterium]
MPNHPIFAPTFHGDVAKVKRILEEDESLVGIRDAKKLTPLHVAASRGQANVARLLLEHGADVNGPSDPGDWTPIVYAAYRGHLEVTEVLIEHGADITAEGGNPIHFAGQRKHKDVCRLLVQSGAVDELVDSGEGDILHLFRAAYSYDSETVREILDRRPEIANALDVNGRTALHEACTQGDTKTVRVLLAGGVDTTIRDRDGKTAADRAESHRQKSVMRILEKHAAAD